MSSQLDPSLLDQLRPALRAALEAQLETALKAEAELRRHLKAENADLREHNDRLEHLVRELQRARFGPRSEQLHPDQMEWAFEDIEVAIAAATEEHDAAARARAGKRPVRQARGPRRLPKDLPREERVIEPEDLSCPCGCGLMVRIGEERSERLDVIPAQFRVLETIRPRYACPKGRGGVVQAKAAPALIEGGLPTEALLAHIAISKFSEHLPLYRQAQVMARQGIEIDRSTLADWMGKVAFHLRPIVARMAEHMKGAGKLFADETTLPVLNPGAGKTKTGYLWAMVRDDRPWGGAAPPAVVFTYAPGRGGAHAEDMLRGFEGILQVDGYKGYDRLADGRRAEGGALKLAFCWAHLWMAPLWQGIFARSRRLPRLQSSIRPVMTTRPAPPASMVNPRTGSQSLATSSRLGVPNGFVQFRYARFRHHAQFTLASAAAPTGRWERSGHAPLRRTVDFTVAQHRPDDACRLVGDRHHRDVRWSARAQLREPGPALATPAHDRSAAMDQ